MVHLKNVTTTPICLNVFAIKMQSVKNLKDSIAKVYDYVIQGEKKIIYRLKNFLI